MLLSSIPSKMSEVSIIRANDVSCLGRRSKMSERRGSRQIGNPARSTDCRPQDIHGHGIPGKQPRDRKRHAEAQSAIRLSIHKVRGLIRGDMDYSITHPRLS